MMGVLHCGPLRPLLSGLFRQAAIQSSELLVFHKRKLDSLIYWDIFCQLHIPNIEQPLPFEQVQVEAKF